jgi:hypothetical protein
MVVSGSRSVAVEEEDEMTAYYAAQQVESAGSLPFSSQRTVNLSETDSGIGWKFANQGQSVLPRGTDCS